MTGSAMSMLALTIGARAVGTKRKSTRSALHFFGSSVTPAPVPAPVFKVEDQFGASQPLGFFDPLGFSTSGDEAYFRKLREAELKHGRVAMLASVGFWAEHLAKVPGFAGEPEGVMNAFDDFSKQQHMLPFIFLLCGWLELGIFKQDADKEVGDFGDPLKLGQYTEDFRLKELNNGRMAMVAVALILGTEWLTGEPSTKSFWFPLGALQQERICSSGRACFAGASAARRKVSSARAFFGSSVTPAPVPTPVFKVEDQFGASQPLGFFDPLGFSTSGDEAYFRKLREAELKHGRVAMLASVGFWAEHLAKVPGFAGEPEGVMNAFDDFSKQQHMLPFIFLLCGWLELGIFKQDANKEVGDFGDPLKLGQYTEDFRLKELNNGRMAMVAVALILGTEWLTGEPSTKSFWFPL